jgi:hypothetical protein
MTILLAVTNVYGQKSTEMYIPIGKSPGLSDKYTTIGAVEQLDTQARTLTCKDTRGVTVEVAVDEKTRIWLDRSRLKLPNLYGSLMDCEQGLLVEVKYRNNERKPGAVADWIKVQATE